MVNIIDLRLTPLQLASRVIFALIVASLIIFFFYYLPGNVYPILSPFVPANYLPEINTVVSILTSPGIPFLGVLLAVFAFFDIFLSGSWTYGIILVISGVLYIVYDYLVITGGMGSLLSGFPPAYTQYVSSGSLTTIMYWVLVVLIISSIVSIARGIALIARGPSRSRLGPSPGIR